jgi:hypothetical protein
VADHVSVIRASTPGDCYDLSPLDDHPMGGLMYGELEPVATLKKCNEVMPEVVDPTGRYVGWRNGLTVTILDTAPDVPVSGPAFKSATSTWRHPAISPDGARLAIRDQFGQRLEVRTAAETLAIKTDTRLMTWDGKPLNARTPAPRWGFGTEYIAFDTTGEFVVLITHQADGQACVQLYRSDTLALVDTLTDLRLYSYYATNGEAPYVAMPYWSESAFVQDPLDPGLILGVRNAGDSCLGVFGFRAENGRLTQVDPEALSASAFKVDDYCLRGLRRLPQDGPLVVDRDHHIGRVAWPPRSPATREQHRFALQHLQDDTHAIRVPWVNGDRWTLEPSEVLSITPDHLLMNIDADRFTVGLAAFDPVTFAPLGLVRRPQDRLRFGEIAHLGGDLFAGIGSSTTRLWRLRR